MSNILDNIKNFLFNFIESIIKPINQSNILFYFIYFLLFFSIYFLSNLSSTSNIFDPLLNKINDNKLYLIIFYVSIGIMILSLLGIGYYYSFKVKVQDDKKKVNIITGSIFCLFLATYVGIGIIKKYILKLPDLFFKIMRYTFFAINYIFAILFFFLLCENINKQYNIEAFISLELITIFIFLNLVNTVIKFNKYNKLLQKNDFNLLTINCKPSTETFSDDNSNKLNPSIKSILNKYGNNYLRYSSNIPISFLNSNTNNYQDLTFNDFYYPSSCYSYLADNPLNGTPNLKALELAISMYKSRIVELDLFTDIEDSDPKAKLVVRSKDLKEGSLPLNLEDCFEVINKYAWIPNNSNYAPYPFMLNLNIYFEDYESLYIKLYNSLLKYFSKYLLEKKYSYAGRNGSTPVSEATMKECIGKIIISTNKFPTHTILDEIINACTNDLTPDLKIIDFKMDYAKFDVVGISQDYDKNTLVSEGKNYFRLFKSEPVESYFTKNQPKSGLFNPKFQDAAQYGIQGTMMYLFLPDDNFNLWYEYFKNKSNFDPILKDQSLRYVMSKQTETENVNPTTGLQTPQKYCVAPNGFMDTSLGNLSEGNNNVSCNSLDGDDTYDVNTGVSVT